MSAAATASVWAAGLLVGVVDLVYMRVSLDLFDESFDDPDIHLTYGYSSYEELLAEVSNSCNTYLDTLKLASACYY